MLLGDMLVQLYEDSETTEVILDVGDLRLLSAMQERAERQGLDLATYARAAVHRYAAEASNEEWITLMGQIGRTSDPGRTCLKRAFDNAIRV